MKKLQISSNGALAVQLYRSTAINIAPMFEALHATILWFSCSLRFVLNASAWFVGPNSLLVKCAFSELPNEYLRWVALSNTSLMLQANIGGVSDSGLILALFTSVYLTTLLRAGGLRWGWRSVPGIVYLYLQSQCLLLYSYPAIAHSEPSWSQSGEWRLRAPTRVCSRWSWLARRCSCTYRRAARPSGRASRPARRTGRALRPAAFWSGPTCSTSRTRASRPRWSPSGSASAPSCTCAPSQHLRSLFGVLFFLIVIVIRVWVCLVCCVAGARVPPAELRRDARARRAHRARARAPLREALLSRLPLQPHRLGAHGHRALASSVLASPVLPLPAPAPSLLLLQFYILYILDTVAIK